MRAVFDTNVVVSALVFGRRLAWLRNAWASGRLVPVICQETTSELLRVLRYPKFRLSAADRKVLLEDYLTYAEIVPLPDPRPTLPVTCRDREDVVFLQLSMATDVPLVSGDAVLKALREVAPMPVLSGTELQDRLLR